MLSITQQAQRVLSAYREEDRPRGTLSRVSACGTGIEIQAAPPLAEDTINSDVNGPVLAIDPNTARDWSKGTVLYLSDGSRPRRRAGRVGLVEDPRWSAARRPGFVAIAPASLPARSSRQGPVLRVVGAIPSGAPMSSYPT